MSDTNGAKGNGHSMPQCQGTVHYLVVGSHSVQELVKQHNGLNFIESAESLEPFFISETCSEIPARCHDFYS